MKRIIREYGTITRVWVGKELVIILSDPKYVEVRTAYYRGILTNNNTTKIN
jgi:hypothetical protein